MSPARFTDWKTLLDARALVDRIRERSGGIPVGVKMSAQHVEADLDAALDLGIDYVILDGRGGGTGAAPTIFRDTISVPTMAALARARRHLDLAGARDVTLVATGGFRRAQDMVKALALGADAIAVSNVALQAIGCVGMRACHTDNCPMGIATQKPHLRARLPVQRAAEQLTRYLGAITELMVVLARACGHDSLSHFTPRDLTSWKRDVAELVGVSYAGVGRDAMTTRHELAPHRRPSPTRAACSTAIVDGRSVAVTRCGGRVGALDNHCPHQGGPLGEGSIENGLLRCPWHGYDYDPTTGAPPAGFSDAPVAYPVEERADGTYVELPDVAERPRSVSDVLVETLVAWGVDTVFGMVGHSNLGFAEALRKAEERGELRYIGIRHEGAAAFAASAYGKLTGRPAACFAIAGPGSTNLLTGLYDASLDGAPVLAISGQVPSKVLGRGAFQDVDLSAVFRDVAAVHGDRARRLRPRRAGGQRRQARAGRPRRRPPGAARRGAGRPVRRPARRPRGRRADLAVAPVGDALDAAVDRLRAARRPVIIVGQGARGAAHELRELAERLGAPVLTTFRAKGLVPDTHPLGAGVLGRSGTPVASWLMNESDLLLVVGASFANHTGIAPVQADRADRRRPSAIGRFHPVDVGILGDAAVSVRLLLDWLGRRRSAVDQRPDVAAPPGDLARGEGPPRRGRPGPRRRQRRRLRRPVRALPGGRRRSRSTSATTPTPSAATSRAPGSRC